MEWVALAGILQGQQPLPHPFSSCRGWRGALCLRVAQPLCLRWGSKPQCQLQSGPSFLPLERTRPQLQGCLGWKTVLLLYRLKPGC